MTWIANILIDTSEDPRPEWCEVCSDDTALVPSRAVATCDGIRLCATCAEYWHSDIAPSLRRAEGLALAVEVLS